MKTISGIEFASEHNGTDVFRLIELAYEQGWKDGHSEQLGTNLAEVGTDQARTVKGFPIDADLLMLKVEEEYGFMARDRLYELIRNMPKYELPSAQPTFDARDTQYNLPIGTDCISRQAVITALVYAKETGTMKCGELKCVIEVLNKVPSAQPMRGRWISADAIFGGVPFYCSECGENTRDTVMGKPRWNFCPNCGADMREVTT